MAVGAARGGARFAALVAVGLVALVAGGALGACAPKIASEDVLLEKRDATCAFTNADGPLGRDVQEALHRAAQGLGSVHAVMPAERYVRGLTRDGYFVRRTAANLVMSLAGVGIGALAAALLLTVWTRRPTPRWSERVGQSIDKEIEQLRALGHSGDALAKALVQRLDEPLSVAAKKAQRLVERAVPLARRPDSTTAVAHLASLEAQLEALLARVERIHLQIVVWNERQLKEEDEVVKAQVASAIADLSSALEEVK